MKKILFSIVIILMHLNLFAQSEERQNKKDYFNIGLYSGYYKGNAPLLSKWKYTSTLTFEIEYFKFSDLSFVFRDIYVFSKAKLYDLEGIKEQPWIKLNEPRTNRINISIMARYYLGGNKFRPYLQTGLNHEYNYIGDYTIDFYDPDGNVYETYSNHSYDINRYSLNFGAGLNIELTKKFSLDMNYDIYKALGNNNGVEYFYDENSDIRSGFNGYSFQMGLKYTFL